MIPPFGGLHERRQAAPFPSGCVRRAQILESGEPADGSEFRIPEAVGCGEADAIRARAVDACCITYTGLGGANGTAKLYLNGQLQGRLARLANLRLGRDAGSDPARRRVRRPDG